MSDEVYVGSGVRPDTFEQHASAPDFSDWGVRSASSFGVSDLRPFSPSRKNNQGRTNSCVAQATTRAAEIKQVQQIYDEYVANGMTHVGAATTARGRYVPLSRRMAYFFARDLMPTRADGSKETEHDEGTQASLAAEALRIWGASPEEPIAGRPATECWPWDATAEGLRTSPSWMAMRHAYVHKITKWAKIKNLGAFRVEDCLANLSVGNPVVFCTRVDETWMRHRGTEVLRLPAGDRGNHAMLLVGWDPSKEGGAFILENSWGADWGDGGYAYVSPDVIGSDLTFDLVAMYGGWEPWKAGA